MIDIPSSDEDEFERMEEGAKEVVAEVTHVTTPLISMFSTMDNTAKTLDLTFKEAQLTKKYAAKLEFEI